MKKRAEHRTEVKTRLSDDVYQRLRRFKEQNRIDSDSEALSQLACMGLFGFLPPGYFRDEERGGSSA